MIDFAALQDLAYTERLYDTRIHGLSHWRQVESNGILLASKTRANIDVVRLFAIFHDCKRIDDAYDASHGGRGAEFAKECYRKKLFEISESDFDLLYHACCNHTTEHCCGNPTIDTCYDADRLDLGRVGFVLNPQKMATDVGAMIAKQSLKENVPVECMREWLKKLQLK